MGDKNPNKTLKKKKTSEKGSQPSNSAQTASPKKPKK